MNTKATYDRSKADENPLYFFILNYQTIQAVLKIQNCRTIPKIQSCQKIQKIKTIPKILNCHAIQTNQNYLKIQNCHAIQKILKIQNCQIIQKIQTNAEKYRGCLADAPWWDVTARVFKIRTQFRIF